MKTIKISGRYKTRKYDTKSGTKQNTQVQENRGKKQLQLKWLDHKSYEKVLCSLRTTEKNVMDL